MLCLKLFHFSTSLMLVVSFLFLTTCYGVPVQTISPSPPEDLLSSPAPSEQTLCSPVEEGDHLPKSNTQGVWTKFEGPTAQVADCLTSFFKTIMSCADKSISVSGRNLTIDFLNEDHPVDFASGPCDALLTFAACFEEKVNFRQLDFSHCVEESALNMTGLVEKHCRTSSGTGNKGASNGENVSGLPAEVAI